MVFEVRKETLFESFYRYSQLRIQLKGKIPVTQTLFFFVKSSPHNYDMTHQSRNMPIEVPLLRYSTYFWRASKTGS